jgi:hypothetical protein
MKNEINSYWIEDYHVTGESEHRIDYEVFPRFLCDAKQLQGSEVVEVSNVLSSKPRQYHVGILKNSANELEEYQIATGFKIWLFPETSFQVQLTFTHANVPVVHIWISRQEYLFFGFPEDLLFTLSGKFPVKSFTDKLDIEMEKSRLMESMPGKLPKLEQFLNDLTTLAKERIQQYKAPPVFIDYLRQYEISPQINETNWDYYTRLFNLLTSLQHNLGKNHLINLHERSEISSFITRTLLEGRVFD